MPHPESSTRHAGGRLSRLALAALLCCAAAACTTTGSPSKAGRDSSDTGRGVTVFGDIDAGVSRVRN